jgi:hypothetical protein
VLLLRLEVAASQNNEEPYCCRITSFSPKLVCQFNLSMEIVQRISNGFKSCNVPMEIVQRIFTRNLWIQILQRTDGNCATYFLLEFVDSNIATALDIFRAQAFVVVTFRWLRAGVSMFSRMSLLRKTFQL